MLNKNHKKWKLGILDLAHFDTTTTIYNLCFFCLLTQNTKILKVLFILLVSFSWSPLIPPTWHRTWPFWLPCEPATPLSPPLPYFPGYTPTTSSGTPHPNFKLASYRPRSFFHFWGSHLTTGLGRCGQTNQDNLTNCNCHHSQLNKIWHYRADFKTEWGMVGLVVVGIGIGK